MKKISLFYLVLASTLNFSYLNSLDTITDEFREIDCEVRLRVRPFEQEDPTKRSSTALEPYTHPLIPLKKGVRT